MLDNSHLVDAYKLLQTTPIKTADSVSVAGSINTSATSKATSLSALKSATVSYPASITAHITTLTDWAALLTRAATVAKAFNTDMTPHQSPEQMVKLYIGWQCYCKIKGQPDTTTLHTNNAIADTTVVNGLKAGIDAVNLAALTTAWTAINTALTPAPVPAGSPQGTTPVTPTLTQAQIDALTAAMTAATPMFSSLATKIDPVDTLRSTAKADADAAYDAFTRAVSVQLLNNLASNDILNDSIKAIVTIPLYQALKAANTDNS